MKRVLRLVVAAWLCLSPWRGVAGQADSLWWNNSAGYIVPIEEVAVVGRRPMKEIGRQKSEIEQGVLHENIASSMADVLGFNSALFVKQYGRATLSTVAFRGTSAAHTQVTWNGLKVHSPMVGMTDFSLIPSHLIDRASLLHGSSSIALSGGGLGGAVELESRPSQREGLHLQFVQGIGSYSTFDEFLRLDYGTKRWQSSTRLILSTSQNDYHYINYRKKEHIYNEEHQIVESYYPTEVNRNCDFTDLHLMQEVSHTLSNGDRLALSAWYLHSRRGVPMLMVHYGDEQALVNEQRERTLRTVAEWQHIESRYKVEARAGYTFSRQFYDYQRDPGNGIMNPLIASRNRIHTLYAELLSDLYASEKWLFSGSLTLHNHWVESLDECALADKNYDCSRAELSLYLSAKWSPTERLGLSVALREELYGGDFSPLIPHLAADYLLSRRGNLLLKGSVARNYRYPTLNDLYYQPGGNPDLRPEKGFTYDVGLSFCHSREGHYTLEGSATWFDSYIEDWILWQPTGAGYWTPKNLKKVHAYGIELKGSWRQQLARDWQTELTANFSWTPSINQSEPLNSYDQSVGKQLAYIPEYSASVGASLIWRSWRLGYKGHYYSRRYTSTDNNAGSLLGYVEGYFLSEASLEKQLSVRWADFSFMLQAKNLFDIEYESVLARPMPGIHFELFLEIRPRWGKEKR